MQWMRLIIDTVFGTVMEYKDASVKLAKIQAAKYYLEIARMLRLQSLLFLYACVGIMVLANTLIAIEILIVLSKISLGSKIGIATAVAAAGIIGIIFLIECLFSHRRWMRLTGADRLLAKVLGK